MSLAVTPGSRGSLSFLTVFLSWLATLQPVFTLSHSTVRHNFHKTKRGCVTPALRFAQSLPVRKASLLACGGATGDSNSESGFAYCLVGLG